MSAVLAEARWLSSGGVIGPHDHRMQRTALCAADGPERWADKEACDGTPAVRGNPFRGAPAGGCAWHWWFF